LHRYGQFLAANPNIILILSGGLNQDIDRTALKTQLEDDELQRVTEENRRRLEKWREQKEVYRKALEQKRQMLEKEGKILEMNIPPKFLQEFTPSPPEPIKVNENMLQKLAEQRVQSVYRYFTDQLTLDPARITVKEMEDSSAIADGSSGGVALGIKPLPKSQQ